MEFSNKSTYLVGSIYFALGKMTSIIQIDGACKLDINYHLQTMGKIKTIIGNGMN